MFLVMYCESILNTLNWSSLPKDSDGFDLADRFRMHGRFIMMGWIVWSWAYFTATIHTTCRELSCKLHQQIRWPVEIIHQTAQADSEQQIHQIVMAVGRGRQPDEKRDRAEKSTYSPLFLSVPFFPETVVA